MEIGVWKSLFTHLLRLLEAVGGGKKEILNSRCVLLHHSTVLDLKLLRYRQVPTFGCNTIRRFSHDVSGMKQLGARDFEDLLQVRRGFYFIDCFCSLYFQCALPTFEGLLPNDHNDCVQDLLFGMAHWHVLSKLRMHTDATLELLDSWTSILGEAAHIFVTLTCNRFQTRELKSEYEARKRKESRKSSEKEGKGGPNSGSQTKVLGQEGASSFCLPRPYFNSRARHVEPASYRF